LDCLDIGIGKKADANYVLAMIKLSRIGKVIGLLSISMLAFAPLRAATLPGIVKQSVDILDARQGTTEPIPLAELAKARGVAITDITKGGFIIGGTGGDGVVLVKIKKGLSGAVGMTSWSAPIPVSFSGGSFGAQIGGSNTKAIILLNSDKAVQVFTHPGKLAWNAQAVGTAGADTKKEGEGGLLSDVDVKIYKIDSGVYGGATFGGSSLRIQDDTIKAAYGANIYVRDIIEGKVKVPEYAGKLVNLLDGKR
jgi:lipid-binding SYLF domain-containing protein